MTSVPRRIAQATIACCVGLLLFSLLVFAAFAQENSLPNDTPPADRSEVRGTVGILHADNFEARTYTTTARLHLEDGRTFILAADSRHDATAGQEANARRDHAIDWERLAGQPVVATVASAALLDAANAAAQGIPGLPLSVLSVRLDTNTAPKSEPGHQTDPTAEDANNATTLRYVNLLCRFNDVGANPPAPAVVASWFDPGRVNSYSHYYRTVSYGNLTIEFTTVAQWRTMPVALTPIKGNIGAISTALEDRCPALYYDVVDFSKYDGVIFFTNGDFGGFSFAGGAFLKINDGTRREFNSVYLSWFNANKFGHTVIAHEIGHSLGAPHTLADDGMWEEYSNDWDVMSGQPCFTPADSWEVWNSCAATDFITWHKLGWGWIAPTRILTVTQGISTVVKLDWLASAGSASNFMVIKIPLAPDLYYTIEARKKDAATYDRSLPGTALVIHEVGENRSPPTMMVNTIPVRTVQAAEGIEQGTIGAETGGVDTPEQIEPDEGSADVVGATWYNQDLGIQVQVVGQHPTGLWVRVMRNAAALQGAPARALSLTVDDTQRGDLAVVARVQNLSNRRWDDPILYLDTGYWFDEFRQIAGDIVVSGIQGATCDVYPSEVVCELPALAAGAVHWVTMHIAAKDNGVRLFRSYLFAPRTTKLPTDVTLVNVRGWSAMAVSISPAQQPVSEEIIVDFSITNAGATARAVEANIYFPPELGRFRRGFDTTNIEGIYDMDMEYVDDYHMRMFFPMFGSEGEFSVRLEIAPVEMPPPGGYPLVVAVDRQSPDTPDQRTSDNSAAALLCMNHCRVPASYDQRALLPTMRR